MGAFRIGNAKTATIFTPALDMTNVITGKVAPMGPVELAIIPIVPMEIGITSSDVTTYGSLKWGYFSGFWGGFQVADTVTVLFYVSEVSAL